MKTIDILKSYKEGKLSTTELRQKLNSIKNQNINKIPLSKGQKGIWMLEKVNSDMSAYNIPICFRIYNKIDIHLFNQALNFVVDKYPILKTIIKEKDGVPYQQIKPNQIIQFEIKNISNLDHHEIFPYINKIAKEPFSLSNGPLLRTYIFETSKEPTYVLINVHHIIFDGISIGIFLSTFLDTYIDLIEGKDLEIKKSDTSYEDFIIWENGMLSGEKGKKHQLYWKKQLSGSLPILELPTDGKRYLAKFQKGETHRTYISSELLNKVKLFVEQQQISLATLFIGIFKLLLYQYSNQNDIIIGMASMVRPQKRFESQIGYFINMIPIRSQIDDNLNFIEFVKELQLTMLDALDHADYPFTQIVKDLNLPRSLESSPIFQVGYFYQNFIQANTLSKLNNYQNKLHIDFLEEIHQEGEYELSLEIFEQEKMLQINMKYNPYLYNNITIRELTNNLLRLTEAIVIQPELSLKEFPLISKEIEKKLLIEWNMTEKNYTKDKLIYELFQEQVKKMPNAKAVIYENESLTYHELDILSNKLAIYLQKKEINSKNLIGICMERSLNMIIGLLAILKSGSAYVPMDPDYPTERLSYMIENSKVPIMLTQSELMPKIKQLLKGKTQAIALDTCWDIINKTVDEQDVFENMATADSLAYVIYTSGSTGNPKGVMIPHIALTNFLLSMADAPGIVSKDKLLAVTTFCFDIAGLELFLPLIKGAECHICSTANMKNIAKLKKEIERVKPSIMQATPATWMALFQIGWRNKEKLKILCGGEALSEKLKKYFTETNSEIWNMFGPTETTIWSTIKRIKEEEPITIGKAIANTQIYILNKHKKPVPIGVPGILYIGGDGLALGYLNLQKLTEEKFINNPFNQSTKIYNTGDLAKWLPSGDIEFIGRIDDQVKFHGYRIELSEIEHKLNTYLGIKESAVVITEHNETTQLRAFYICKEESRKRINQKHLRRFLQKTLPSYMIPNVFIELESLPLTPNGKVNRLKLSKQTLKLPKETKNDSKNEIILLNIWKDVIGIDQINLEDGFFEIGGDSITAVILAERISKRFDCDLTVTAIFEHLNIRNLSKYISELKNQNNSKQEKEEILQDQSFNIRKEDKKNKTTPYPDYYKDSIAIIGISCQFPEARNSNEFWNNLKEGKESVDYFSKEELKALNVPNQIIENPKYVPIKLTIDGKDLFDPEFFNLSPKDAENMDPQLRLLLLNSWKAIEDAGYISKQIPNTAVYMSTSNNFYQASNESKNVNIISDSEEYVTWLLGQGGTVPTMISYQLGFKGPSYSVHSNCSSSIVGLYSAYQSLRSGEVDYAIVGASTIHSSTSAGHIHVPGLNFSSDGHLRAFDSSADGMIGGEGVAVIVLKKVEKAIKDRDNIYALLRGISLNNDGKDKVGFYAPSVKGQTEVIEKALESTKINPETITYIESHGTGTKLGDPIEIAGLNNVYKKYTTKKHFCGIGSVKTNIGHLDTVSGLAGCIKIALSLKNRLIPPSLNFKEPNEQINFEDSPFYVIDKPKQLLEQSFPHRAALSSFGIGGTNAHAIFERYQEQVETQNIIIPKNDNFYIIPLSAKNDNRLKEYGFELLNFIKKQNINKINIRNLGYTLQLGRESMDSRIIFLVKNIDELIQKLEKYTEGITKINNFFEKNLEQPFEKNQLLEKDEESIELIKKWIAKGKLHKVAILWVKGFQFDWELLYTDSHKPKRISLPTYPFAKEKYWKINIHKNQHETIKNEDTIEKLHPLIDRNISDLSEQKYQVKFFGDEFFLQDHIINNKKVLPGVTYIEMGKVAGEMAINKKIHKIKNIIWSSPIIVETPIKVEIVIYPHVNHIEYKIRTNEDDHSIIHSQGKLEYSKISQTPQNSIQLETLDIAACKERCDRFIDHAEFYKSDNATVYQYGTTFKPIKKMYFNDQESLSCIELPNEREIDFNKFTLHPSLLEGCIQTIVGLMKIKEITPFMPFSIQEIEIFKEFPKKCYAHATVAKQELKNTPPAKFNIKLFDSQGILLAHIKNYSIRFIKDLFDTKYQKSEVLSTIYYKSIWEKSHSLNFIDKKLDKLLVFTDQVELQDKFGSHQVIYVKSGNQFKIYENNIYEIDPSQQNDYQKLLLNLKKKGVMPNKIIHMWAQTSSENKLEDILNKGIYSIFYLTKSLSQEILKEKVKLLFIYHGNKGLPTTLYGAVSGLSKTICLENPKLYIKTIQIQSESTLSLEKIIITEFEIEEEDEICYTHEGRFIKRLKEENIDKITVTKQVPFRNKGVYLITGGMGGLGLIIARHLARTLHANLVLVGRSKIDLKKKSIITELESLGSEVIYLEADVSKYEDVQRILKEIHRKFKTVHGIFHCAGIIDDKLFVNKTKEQIETVITPKVNGTIYLDEIFSKEPLDIFVLFSSTSHLGNVGQADYAYANSFFNYYANYRDNLMHKNQRSGKTLSINWPIWNDGGMQINEATLKLMKMTKGVYPISIQAGIEALENSLLLNHSQIVIFYGNSEKIRNNNKTMKIMLEQKKTLNSLPDLEIDDEILFEKVKNFLIKTTSLLLKISNVDIDKEMEQYGFNSITNTEFANKINDEYKLDVMPIIFFELEQPTIRFLAHYLCEKYSKNLSIHYKNENLSQLNYGRKENFKLIDSASKSLSVYKEDVHIEKTDNYPLRFFIKDEKKLDHQLEKVIDEPIAIIGMAGTFPQSENLEEFWKNLEAEKNLITEIPEDRFDWKSLNDPKIRWGGFINNVDKFDADFFGISEREAEVMDPQHRLFLQVAWHTIEDAGYKPSDLSGTDTGIFVGISTQDYSQLINVHMVENNHYALTGRTPFMLVNRISSILNLHGPSEPIDTACSSSLVAVHKAVEAIRSGACKVALAGGVNIILTPEVHFSFSAAGMLTDTGLCKVFDKEANGTVRSEGIGAILLKKMSNAIEDGDSIYALIRSSAQNHKGKSASLTAPNANAESNLLIEAYKKARIDPKTINYIETHSTGNKLGDPIEITGLKKAFSELGCNDITHENSSCAIGSLKTNVGHMEAAAGIGALIKVVLSLKNQKLLRTLNFQTLNPYINLDNTSFYILNKTSSWNRIEENIPRRAGINAFGFGGVNAHVLLEEYIPENSLRSQIYTTFDNPVIILLSAKNKDRLKKQIKLLLNAIEQRSLTDNDLINIAYTLQVGRESLDERFALSTTSINELKEKLTKVSLDNNIDTSNVYYGKVNKDDDLLTMLAKDDGIEALIDNWIKKREYNKLLPLWVKGLNIDWKRLYKNIKPQRISLPAYPFEKKRHWITIQNKPTTNILLEKNFIPKNINQMPKTNSLTNMSPEHIILNLFSNLLNTDASLFDINRPIADFGIDSIILTQLLQQLQEIDSSIDFETLYNCKTINEIVNVISIPNNRGEDDKVNETFSEINILTNKKEYFNKTENKNLRTKENQPTQTSTRNTDKFGNQFETRSSNIEKIREPQNIKISIPNYSELIRLNKAYDDRPIFWIHGGFGGVEVYRIIAKKIKRPFYGIQSRGYMNDDEPIEGIELMSSYYIRIIQSVQPEGPYDLGGLSLGGVIAYEIARQLQLKGEKVNSIVMLESIYVNKTMRNEWLQISTENFKKDRMFRAANLLLAFSPSKEMDLIPDTKLKLNVTDKEFLEQLITLVMEKDSMKTSNQLRKSIIQFEKILRTLDMSSTFYNVLPMPYPDSIKSYYFCNPSGEFFGTNESFFRLVDKSRVYDYASFSQKWKEKLSGLNILKVKASSHLTLLTEPESQEIITDFCKKLYVDRNITEEYLKSLLIDK